MSKPIESYALLGDTHTAALVARDGSIDWMCAPRFDSPALFAALLGTPDHGRWQIAPIGATVDVRRRYRPGTLVLETDMTTDSGAIRITDCLVPGRASPHLVRRVEGLGGSVRVRSELEVRFDYGSVVPWVRRAAGRLHAVAGPDAVVVDAPVESHGEDRSTVAEFTVGRDDRLSFALAWHPSHQRAPRPVDPEAALAATTAWWSSWTARCTDAGPWTEDVHGSFAVLKALTYGPTGGIVAAATTSLPEQVGGPRNWDYRYCWLRDATFTLHALLLGGHRDEAKAWRDWLIRAIAGDPDRVQIMYGLAGERRLPEQVLDWLPGYEGSRPVRIGNGAVGQLQLDVVGEVLDAGHVARRAGIPPDPVAWSIQRHLLAWLAEHWREPDDGLWEIRSGRRRFTHSGVMSWVAFDRAVRAVERFGLTSGDVPVDRWRAIREEIHDEVCRFGYDPGRGAFVQAAGSTALDASLLLIPLVGFLPPSDPRVRGTVAAIERELTVNGFVLRYRHDEVPDGLPPGEGSFLVCSFWLVDCLASIGRREDARRLFERLLAVRNDVGLYAEEYDPRAGRMLGNLPQAFSHVGLVNSAFNLAGVLGSDQRRAEA